MISCRFPSIGYIQPESKTTEEAGEYFLPVFDIADHRNMSRECAEKQRGSESKKVTMTFVRKKRSNEKKYDPDT